MVDTDGRPLTLWVGSTGVKNRCDVVPLLQASRRDFPCVERAFADTAHDADRMRDAVCNAIEIVRRIPGQSGFGVHPPPVGRRALLRVAGTKSQSGRGFEAPIASAFVYAASAMLLIRRSTRSIWRLCEKSFRIRVRNELG